MVYSFAASQFSLEYIESKINHSVLWESHCHSQFEMIAVAEGDVSVMLEGENYRLKENNILIVPPLQYHTVTANGKGIYRRITALFDLSAIPSVLWDEFQKSDTGIEFSCPSSIEKIKDVCLRDNSEFYAPLIKSLMTEIFYEAAEDRQRLTVKETDEFLQKALKYIDAHLHEKILLDDLALHTARSKSSFCHLFFEKMQVSPKQYILQKKLAMAQKLLDEGIPHTEVAIRLGYTNYSNFYRLYKKNKTLAEK